MVIVAFASACACTKGKDYMKIINCNKLSFSFDTDPLFQDISFSLRASEVMLVVGPIGSGKSTLLRMFKPELMPQGRYGGDVKILGNDVLAKGKKIDTFKQDQSARLIGYVGQDPRTNLVCNTVRNELAFLPENLGEDPSSIRLRMAEIVYYLGISHLLDADCDSLSGGEAQIVALASALMVQPRLLILDEPISQLDSAFQHQFISLIQRLKNKFDMGILIATHMPEEWQDLKCRIISIGELPLEHPLLENAQEAYNAYLACNNCVRASFESSVLLSAKNIFASYEKNQKWVLRGATIEVSRGEIHALVGGNGCGKSTLLRVLSQELRPHKGKLNLRKGIRISHISQDPRLLISADSVYEELAAETQDGRCSKEDVEVLIRAYSFQDLVDKHPYDLSLGQLQLLVFMKTELRQPDVLMLDEPTKGLDPIASSKILVALKKLALQGVAIVVASHDLEAINAIADKVTILFDGQTHIFNSVYEWVKNNTIWTPQRKSLLYTALRHDYERLINERK